jgi:uncharacterized membrane protein YdfJ with MMPL/SSD domain
VTCFRGGELAIAQVRACRGAWWTLGLIIVLIDATVVRGVLLPATLALLGDRAWRLRRTLAPQGLGAAVTPE